MDLTVYQTPDGPAIDQAVLANRTVGMRILLTCGSARLREYCPDFIDDGGCNLYGQCFFDNTLGGIRTIIPSLTISTCYICRIQKAWQHHVDLLRGEKSRKTAPLCPSCHRIQHFKGPAGFKDPGMFKRACEVWRLTLEVRPDLRG